MRRKKARRGAGARPERVEMSGISLKGRSVIVAMCVGQLGSLLPHVVVPAILAAFLIPEWHLTGAQAGLLAGSGAAGYMLTVPLLATLTDRIDARKILIAGSAVSLQAGGACHGRKRPSNRAAGSGSQPPVNGARFSKRN